MLAFQRIRPLQCSPYAVSSARTFFSSPPQKFTVNRTLPHSQEDLFNVISDIDAYASFVPFCKSSVVTERRNGVPCKADLKVGFKSYEETFSSHVRCTPPEKVEAMANHHPLFDKLVTAWRLSKVPARNSSSGSSFDRHQQQESAGQSHDGQHDQECRVHLDIEYQFSNPVYGALSNAVLPKVADQIIAAFEQHAKTVLNK